MADAPTGSESDGSNPLILSGTILVNEHKKICLLYRMKHAHYETPGGKVDPEDAVDPENPSLEELEVAARRELAEEVGPSIEIHSFKYFDSVRFTIPDGRDAIAHKFIANVSGDISVNIAEGNLFDKVGVFSLDELDNIKLSPDLQILLHRLMNRFSEFCPL